MPDWLQATPGWKRSPVAAPTREIPAPDTSSIDPRKLVDVDDLPQWLQAVSTREPRKPVPTVVLSGPETPVTIAPASMPLTGPIPLTPPDQVQESSDTWPPMRDAMRPAERPEPVRLTPSPAGAEQPWWISDAAVAVLFVAIILTMVYVILVATGAV